MPFCLNSDKFSVRSVNVVIVRVTSRLVLSLCNHARDTIQKHIFQCVFRLVQTRLLLARHAKPATERAFCVAQRRSRRSPAFTGGRARRRRSAERGKGGNQTRRRSFAAGNPSGVRQNPLRHAKPATERAFCMSQRRDRGSPECSNRSLHRIGIAPLLTKAGLFLFLHVMYFRMFHYSPLFWLHILQ